MPTHRNGWAWFLVLVATAITGLSTGVRAQDAARDGNAADLARQVTTEPDGTRSLDLGGKPTTDAELVSVSTMHNLGKLVLWDTQVTDAGLTHLEKLKNLKFLGLSRRPITDDGLKHLENLTELRELHLWGTRITDAGLEHLKGLANLEVLWIGATQITDAGLVHLAGLSNLKKLTLNETAISDVGLVHLEKLSQLEELGLWKTEVSGNGLKHLASLERLQILALGHTQTADADLALLRGLNQLRELNLVNTRITDAGMEVLGGFRELRTLYASHIAITDAGLAHLSQLAKLENLDLSFTKIKGEGLTHLKDMPSLRQLSLWNTLIDDDALLHIKPLTSLEILNLANSRITDAGLERIENLVHLKELYLSGTRVTDAGLHRLSRMTDLERLGLLRLAGVTDKSLAHLRGLKKLQDISLAGTGVTPEGTATLKQWFPNATLLTARPLPPQRAVPPVHRFPPGGMVEFDGRTQPPREVKPGPKKITLPDEPNREYVEVVAETAKVKVGNELVGSIQRGDRLPVLRRDGPWVGVLLSRSEGDCLGWVLGNRVRSILPVGFDTQSAAPGSPETVDVRVDHTQIGGSNPTKICFQLTLANSSSQPMPFDSSAVQLLVGHEALVAVERDEPPSVSAGNLPVQRPLRISVPREDRRPEAFSWNDLPRWDAGTVLQPGEQKSAWLAFEVPRWLYPPASTTYPPRSPGQPASAIALPGQSFLVDLAAMPWQVAIHWGEHTQNLDLVQMERNAAVHVRKSPLNQDVTVIEFGERISGLGVGRVFEIYEEIWSKKAPCVIVFDAPCMLIDSVARSRFQMGKLLDGWQQVNSVWVDLPHTVATAGTTFTGSTDEILSGGAVPLANSEDEAVAMVPTFEPGRRSVQQKPDRSPWGSQSPGRTAVLNLRGGLDQPEVLEALMKAIDDSDISVGVAAFDAIEGRLSDKPQGDRFESLRVPKPSNLEGPLLDAVLTAATAEAAGVRYRALRALRYSQDPRATALILKAFTDSDRSVRSAAADASVTRAAADVEPLLKKLLDDPYEHAALAACRTLAQFKNAACIPRLKELQTSKNSFVGRSAIDTLKELGVLTDVEAAVLKIDLGIAYLQDPERQILLTTKDPAAAAKLEQLASGDPANYTAELAACLLAEMKQPSALELLLKRLVPGERISPRVPLALASLADPRAIAPLEEALARSCGPTRCAIYEALLLFKSPGARERIVAEIQRAPQEQQTGMLLWALRRGDPDAAVPVIVPFLDNERWHDAAATIVWDIGTPAAVDELERKLLAADYLHGAAAVKWVVESAVQSAAASDEAGRPELVERLKSFLSGLGESKNDEVRAFAAQQLRDIDGEEPETDS